MSVRKVLIRVGSAVMLSTLVVASSSAGTLLVGRHSGTLGPFPAEVSVVPDFSGATVVNLGLLGEVRLSTHQGPVRVGVELLSLAPSRAGELVTATVRNPDTVSLEEVTEDLRRALLVVSLKSMTAAALLSGFLVWLVYRKWRTSLLGSLLSLALSASVGLTAYLTLDPDAVLEPQYRGLVSAVPTLVGDAREIAGNFERYRAQLGDLLGNVSDLYRNGLQLPDYRTDENTVTLLHVSDLHLNPEGWDVIDLLVERFDAHGVLDTGDISDHGSSAEDPYLAHIGTLSVPYVYVRGNHDSAHTASVIASFPNARVLEDGARTEINGVLIAGTGDPRFTPDKSVVVAGDPEVRASAGRLAGTLGDGEVDVALFHDSTAVEPLDGSVALVLAGHTHRYRAYLLSAGTRLLVSGSTGGGGLRAFTGDKPAPLQATLLHFDRRSGQLVAWDEITMGGVGLASVSLTRHLPGRSEARVSGE